MTLRHRCTTTLSSMLIALAVSPFLSIIAKAAPKYTITDLNPYSPWVYGEDIANGINDAGQVVGAVGYLPSFAYLWTPTQTQLFSDIHDATSINSVGQVAGWFIAYVPSGSNSHAVLVTSGVSMDLGTLGGDTRTTGINDSGQVVGASSIHPDPYYQPHAFLYTNGAIHDLGTLLGYNSYAYGINNAGTVVGQSDFHAFKYANGTMVDLGTLPGITTSTAYAINASGVIVGTSGHAFSYANGTMTDLGTLGGLVSTARAINDIGDIVGSSEITPSSHDLHGFVQHNGTMTDLNTQIDSTLGVTITEARGVNHSGAIVGKANGPNFGGFGVLLTPNVTIAGAPNTPLNVTVISVSPNNLIVSWAPVAGATSYDIFRSLSPSQTPQYYGTVSNITNFADNALVPKTTYYYVIMAHNGLLSGPKSSEASGTTLGFPGNITNLVATPPNPESILLTWDPAVDTDFYDIYGRIAGDPSYALLASVDSSQHPSFLYTGIEPFGNAISFEPSAGNTYEYYIIGRNRFGIGVPTYVSATTPKLADTPTNLVAKPLDPTKIHLTWNPTLGSTGTAVYISNSANGPFSRRVIDTFYNYPYGAYDDTPLLPTMTRYYRIASVTAYGESPVTATIHATTLTILDKPSVFTGISLYPTVIGLGWTAVSGASSYQIYRGPTNTSFHSYVAETRLLTYTDQGVEPGQTYSYIVVPIGPMGRGTKSTPVLITTPTRSTPVELVSAVALTGGRIQLDWRRSYGASGYKVFRSTAYHTLHTYIGKTTALSYIDTGLMPGVAYYYVVIPFNKFGDGGKSNELGATAR